MFFVKVLFDQLWLIFDTGMTKDFLKNDVKNTTKQEIRDAESVS